MRHGATLMLRFSGAAHAEQEVGLCQFSAWVLSISAMISLASATARRTKSWTLISLGISYRCFASFGPSLLIFAPSRTSEECADLVNRLTILILWSDKI